jgi:23S rRNA pseudouridine1911/1915/1917 synthase
LFIPQALCVRGQLNDSRKKLNSKGSGRITELFPRRIGEINPDVENGVTRSYIVTAEHVGQRLDLYLTWLLPETSRSVLTQLIKTDRVLVNGESRKAGYRVKLDEELTVTFPPPAKTILIPEKVDFEVIHEDEALLVLAKPPGIVVHPAHGHPQGTLVHGLLHHLQELPVIGGQQRPGIVHRLDKDTSGLLIVAKNDRSHRVLVELFKARMIKKTYHAIVAGRLQTKDGRIDTQIGRHPVHRKKMAVRDNGGRVAVTRWRVLEEFASPFSYVELQPETGRTHQLRVHMAHMGHPIAGDRLYGKKYCTYRDLAFTRQCLHAYAISFNHPESGREMTFTAPIWSDMQKIIDALRGMDQP